MKCVEVDPLRSAMFYYFADGLYYECLLSEAHRLFDEQKADFSFELAALFMINAPNSSYVMIMLILKKKLLFHLYIKVVLKMLEHIYYEIPEQYDN